MIMLCQLLFRVYTGRMLCIHKCIDGHVVASLNESELEQELAAPDDGDENTDMHFCYIVHS